VLGWWWSRKKLSDRSQGLTAYQKNKSGRAIIIFRIDNFIPFVFDSLSQSSNFDD
jgi:hypothetical protein